MSTHLEPGTTNGRLRRGLIVSLAMVTVLTTAASFSQVAAISSDRTTIVDNLFNAPATPATKFGVYNLTVAPTAPKQFFADGVAGTLQFDTLASGTERITAKVDDIRTYTVTLPKGLVPTLPADSSPSGWDIHWTVTAATGDSTTITRTQTATANHLGETESSETISLPVTATRDVVDRSKVTTSYSQTGHGSDHYTASATIAAVVATDWGIWGAAAIPDHAAKFAAGATGTVQFSTLDPNDTFAKETLTYRTGDVRTYTIELPAGLSYTGDDLDEHAGWDSVVTAAARADGGTTITITQTATRDFADAVFQADTHRITVLATPSITDNSAYSISFTPPERHTTTHPQQAGTIRAMQPIPLGVYSTRATGSGWGGLSSDPSALIFNTLPADMGSAEADFKIGQKVRYTLAWTGSAGWADNNTVRVFSTPHFAGTARLNHQSRQLEIDLTVTHDTENGLYPNEVVSIPLPTGPRLVGLVADVTVDMPDGYASPEATKVPIPSASSLNPKQLTTNGIVTDDKHSSAYTNEITMLGAGGEIPRLAVSAGFSFDTVITLPPGSHSIEFQSSDSGWAFQIIDLEQSPQATTATVRRTASQDAPSLSGQMKVGYKNSGEFGSTDGFRITSVLRIGLLLNDVERDVIVQGWLTTTAGMHNVRLVNSDTGDSVFKSGSTGPSGYFGDLEFDLFPSDVTSETWQSAIAGTPPRVSVLLTFPNPSENGRPFQSFSASRTQDGWKVEAEEMQGGFSGEDSTVMFTFTPASWAGQRQAVSATHLSLKKFVYFNSRVSTIPGAYASAPGTTGFQPGRSFNLAMFAENYTDLTNPGGFMNKGVEFTIE